MSTSARPARPAVPPTRAAANEGLSLPVLLTLGALTAVAPLVTDMYLPALSCSPLGDFAGHSTPRHGGAGTSSASL